MKLSHPLVWAAATLVLLFGSSQPSFAERTTFPVTEARVIVSSEGRGRVLLDFGQLENLPSRWITSAFLVLPISGAAPTEDLNIQACAVTTEWQGRGATWTTPWHTEGGDLEISSPYVTLEKGQSEQLIRLNVTDEIRAVVLGERASYGLALSVPDWRGEGFSASEREILGSLEGASLVVGTVNTGPKEAIRDLGTPR